MADNPYFPHYRVKSLLPNLMLRRIDPVAIGFRVARVENTLLEKQGYGYGYSLAEDLAGSFGFDWLAGRYRYPDNMSALEFYMKMDAASVFAQYGRHSDPQELRILNAINNRLVDINPELNAVRRQQQDAGKEWNFCHGVRYRINPDDINYFINSDHSSQEYWNNLARQSWLMSMLFEYPQKQDADGKPVVYGIVMSPQTMDRLEGEFMCMASVESSNNKRASRIRPDTVMPS